MSDPTSPGDDTTPDDPTSSTPPPPPPAVTPGGAVGMYPEQSQAVLALILGIISIVLCSLTGPFAWWLGKKEVEAIDAGLRSPDNRGSAQAGKILGIIGTALIVVSILVVILAFAGVFAVLVAEST